jgi:hypothetical protein
MFPDVSLFATIGNIDDAFSIYMMRNQNIDIINNFDKKPDSTTVVLVAHIIDY